MQSEAGVGDVFPQENEINRATLCACGKHDLYLDEEIGYMCKNCSYVLEIRHVLPSFVSSAPCFYHYLYISISMINLV